VKKKKLLSLTRMICDDWPILFSRDIKKSPALNFDANGKKTHPWKEKSDRNIENNKTNFDSPFIFIKLLVLLGFSQNITAKI